MCLFSVESSTTEHSYVDGVTIKTEPGNKEGEASEISYTEIDIQLPDIKKECLQYSERIHQTAGKTDNQIVIFKNNNRDRADNVK